MRTKKSSAYMTNLSVIAIIVMTLVTLASVFLFRALIRRTMKLESGGNTFYTYHLAMITESQSDPFWKNVWLAANQEGALKDAYVEWIGSSFTEQYPLATQMEMALAAKVDGILIQPDGSVEITRLISAAIDQGIPVITVMSDASGSGRQGFVGYNSYDLGQLYGQQVRIAMAQAPIDCHAVVLFGGDFSENAQNIIYSSMVESLEGANVTLDVLAIDNTNVFSAEEAIRELVVSSPSGSSAAPDILVCLNATNTICAYQAVVDHNKVGDIQILGYYDSEEILSAVEKRIIQATVAVDANRVGAASVDALIEYLQFSRTSDFTPVDLNVVTTANVAEYRLRTAVPEDEK
ncbi:MAG: substrate-binding domain-containing protein [Eubacteriales bacterium]|nr:substrate-binding domain-containing protein [Eubacteriales bacterium]